MKMASVWEEGESNKVGPKGLENKRTQIGTTNRSEPM